MSDAFDFSTRFHLSVSLLDQFIIARSMCNHMNVGGETHLKIVRPSCQSKPPHNASTEENPISHVILDSFRFDVF